MTQRKPLILLSNDDGIFSEGLSALRQEIKKIGDVAVVAPDTQKSAVGHAITVKEPLRVEKYLRNSRFFGYAVSGTPADCIKLAILSIVERKPDLVISGINHGANTSLNVIYSGTVSAATEGTIFGIPSIAVSLASYASLDFSVAASFARKLARMVLRKGLPKGTFLNVNVPAARKKEITGVRITRQGTGGWIEEFDRRQDPSNRTYYWLKGIDYVLDSQPDSDQLAIMEKAISVTPIHYDMTDYKNLNTLHSWKLVP